MVGKPSQKTVKDQIESLKEMYARLFENENRSSEWYDNLLAIVHCQINDLDSSVEDLVDKLQKRRDVYQQRYDKEIKKEKIFCGEAKQLIQTCMLSLNFRIGELDWFLLLLRGEKNKK